VLFLWKIELAILGAFDGDGLDILAVFDSPQVADTAEAEAVRCWRPRP